MPLNLKQLGEQIDEMVTTLQERHDEGDDRGAIDAQAEIDELEAQRLDELAGVAKEEQADDDAA